MVLKLYIATDDLLVSSIDLKKIVLGAAEASFLDNKTKSC
jgi:hypothetical protein